MNEKKDIGNHIINHFLENEGSEISHPVLVAWLAESELNQNEFKEYQNIWEKSKFYMASEAFDSEMAWKKINEQCQRKKKAYTSINNIRIILLAVAASFLILFVLSQTGIFNKKSEIQVSVQTNYGNRSEILLPDGSFVKLSAGSNLSYSFDSKKNIRLVTFQGEGFFNVAKSKIPFVVQMENDLVIKVLGTSFNIQAYADDPHIETSLVEGDIEMVYENQALSMKAGEIVLFDKQTRNLKRVDGVLEHAYGWLENKLYMNDMSLSEVCKNLERWYDLEIILGSGLGNKYHYNGVIEKETIADVMDALARLSEISYEVKGKTIQITSK